jgi:hypothetical protein
VKNAHVRKVHQEMGDIVSEPVEICFAIQTRLNVFAARVERQPCPNVMSKHVDSYGAEWLFVAHRQ